MICLSKNEKMMRKYCEGVNATGESRHDEINDSTFSIKRLQGASVLAYSDFENRMKLIDELTSYQKRMIPHSCKQETRRRS